MIGKDENQEEVSYKVADRRKFNPDGSLKEGVTLDQPTESTAPVDEPMLSESPAVEIAAEQHDGPEIDSEDDIPGAEDPASFVNFLSMVATNAATALGAVANPATGKRSLDLDTGKFWLDTLAMLKEKTKGNLHSKESQLLDGLLGDLRMQYVHLVRATEEKLKAQAAAKFSNDDILGKK